MALLRPSGVHHRSRHGHRRRPDRLTPPDRLNSSERESLMQITRPSIDTQKGPADWCTGDVYIDAIAAPAGTSTFAPANVHFTPGAQTACHTHPPGQTI